LFPIAHRHRTLLFGEGGSAMRRYLSWLVLISLSVAAGVWAYSVAPTNTSPRQIPEWSVTAKLGLAVAVAVALFLLVGLVLRILKRTARQERLWVICALLGWLTAGVSLAGGASLLQAIAMRVAGTGLFTPDSWIWGRAAIGGLFFGLLAVGVLFGLSCWSRRPTAHENAEQVATADGGT
jgi:hypothetical protein